MGFTALGAFCSLGTRRLVNFSWALPMGTVPCLLPDTALCTVPFTVPLTASCAHGLPRTPFTHWVRRLQFPPVSQHLPTTFPGILVLPPTTFSGQMESQRFYQGQLRVPVLPTPLPQEETPLHIPCSSSSSHWCWLVPLQVPSTKDSQDHRRRGQWEGFRGGERVTAFLYKR